MSVFIKKNGTHGCVNSLDLFMSPKKVTYYVNLFESGQAYHHMSEAEAKLAAAIINPDNRIAVAVPVTIEV